MDLDQDVERLIEAFVASGQFESRDDVLESAIRALAEQHAAARARVKAHVEGALDGPFIDDAELGRHFEAKFEALDRRPTRAR